MSFGDIVANTTDCMLTDMLREEFDDNEKAHFMLNFHLYLAYGNKPNAFVINLEDIREWLGFTTKGKAKHLLVNNFDQDNDFTIATVAQDNGRPLEKILMNVSTFKELCMIAKTAKAKQTRKYYAKMEKIFFTYMERKNAEQIRNIQEQNEVKLTILEKELKEQREQEHHNTLIDAHRNQPVLYVLKVYDNDNLLVKIGETDDLVSATLLTLRILQSLQSFDADLDEKLRDNLDDYIAPMPFILI